MTASLNEGHRKRLRERFSKASLEGFHDYEVLELLLTFAIPRRDVKPLAKELIREFKGLKGVLDAGVGDLSAVNGIGESAAVLIALLREMAGAYINERMSGRARHVRSPEDVFDFLKEALGDGVGERLIAVYLNSKNEILGAESLHEGSLKSFSASPRKVIEKAIAFNARSIIFAHSSPAKGPAELDRRIARDFEDAASHVDILVHDYVFSGKGTRLSAREAGWFKGEVG
ncbi:MAG: RadC family protein [Deltaproteobacteria bacterium]|nr:RadC family protein [Deltaproteobacteria bacterium]